MVKPSAGGIPAALPARSGRTTRTAQQSVHGVRRDLDREPIELVGRRIVLDGQHHGAGRQRDLPNARASDTRTASDGPRSSGRPSVIGKPTLADPRCPSVG
jgi:hypothetical protein